MRQETIERSGHFFRPKYKIFFSVDIVNSTAMKAPYRVDKEENYFTRIGSELSEDWLNKWIIFYSKFPTYFFEEWSKIVERLPKPKDHYVGESPEFWKSIGDELIFVKSVTERRQVHVAVKAWVNALERFKRDSKLDLKLKSAVFGAGFPITNSELLVERKSSQEVPGAVSDYRQRNKELIEQYYEDRRTSLENGSADDDSDDGTQERRWRYHDFSLEYLGPAIDAGFRLADFSSARKLILSCDVAWFLFETPMGSNDCDELQLQLPLVRNSGLIKLSGVYSEISYPQLWLDMGETETEEETDPLSEFSDELFQPFSKPLNQNEISELLLRFYNTYSSIVNKPFIWEERPGHPNSRGKEVPEDFCKAVCKKIELYRNELEKTRLPDTVVVDEETGEENSSDSKSLKDKFFEWYNEQIND